MTKRVKSSQSDGMKLLKEYIHYNHFDLPEFFKEYDKSSNLVLNIKKFEQAFEKFPFPFP
jgi:hypothetical protein